MASQNKRLSTSLNSPTTMAEPHHPTNTMSSSAEQISSNQYYHKPSAERGRKCFTVMETNGMEASRPFFTLAQHWIALSRGVKNRVYAISRGQVRALQHLI
jgi:hypothetical protein